MAKQSAPIQEVARLLDLVPYLSTHSHVSLKELSEEFGISEKEMSAELTALSMCGLPGYTPYELIEIFFESGFVTINNHDALDIPRALTNLEVASLLIGLALLRESLEDAGEVVLMKIDALSASLTSLIGESIEIEVTPDVAHLARVSRAIASRSSLKISYSSSLDTALTERVISPLSIYTSAAHTYIHAFCHSVQGYRNFRTDRIFSIEDGPVVSTPTDSPESSEKFPFSLHISGNRRAISEALSLDSIPQDGNLSLEAFSPTWVEKLVLAFAPHIELKSPSSSREAISEQAQRILALYRS